MNSMLIHDTSLAVSIVMAGTGGSFVYSGGYLEREWMKNFRVPV